MTKRRPARVPREAIKPGAVFGTEFEDGCIVLSACDEQDTFDGLDSDGVVVSYPLEMVTELAGGQEGNGAGEMHCIHHGPVPYEHACRAPGETPGQFSKRASGEWRDV